MIDKHSGEETGEGLSGPMLMVSLSFQSTSSFQQEAYESSARDSPPIFGVQVPQALHHIFQALTDSQKAYDTMTTVLDFLSGAFERELGVIRVRLNNLETKVRKNINLASNF